MDTIIQLSGGIDSTYLAYEYLRNNKDKTLLIHHIHLYNHEGRVKYEAIAVKNILKWFRANGLSNYNYVLTSFDYGNMRYIIKDIEVCGFFLGIFKRSKIYEEIKNVLMPIYAKEGERFERAKEIYEIVSKNAELNFHYPLRDLTKQEVIQRMPEDLLKLCWYCRNPTSSGQICGKCHTCKEVKGIE